MAERRVGVLGASSLVGEWLLPMLVEAGWQVEAFSRAAARAPQPALRWQGLPIRAQAQIAHWICVAPVWVLPEHLEAMRAAGARRIVALSSTSRFTKGESSDAYEQSVVRRLSEGEETLQRWASEHGIEWVILRPTLIYDQARDQNIGAIARLIRRLHCFPLFGAAAGLRQPIHAQDVAAASMAALTATQAPGHAYNISGGETLSYREMVCRVFAALGRRPRLLRIPLRLFRVAMACVRVLPACRHWSSGMAERMNRDLVFDHSDAARDLGFAPRPFILGKFPD
ncbi:NAD(P)-dependent oxidoreductase [Uliginosibacterium sediminicola]|uniref:NAD(P)-dependent oxidoreductase n=1 Tax=Uliginosibacterium sediminicola TaxID=2024550 RepID=A0ABU9YWY8_9RHOO